jgi:hypothetical protein
MAEVNDRRNVPSVEGAITRWHRLGGAGAQQAGLIDVAGAGLERRGPG